MVQHLQYFVVSYSPEAIGNVQINLGVVLIAPDAKLIDARFVDDWGKVRLLRPRADIGLLRAICLDIQERIKHGDAEEIIRIMEDSFSNTIRVSERMEYDSDNPVRALDELATAHLYCFEPR